MTAGYQLSETAEAELGQILLYLADNEGVERALHVHGHFVRRQWCEALTPWALAGELAPPWSSTGTGAGSLASSVAARSAIATLTLGGAWMGSKLVAFLAVVVLAVAGWIGVQAFQGSERERSSVSLPESGETIAAQAASLDPTKPQVVVARNSGEGDGSPITGAWVRARPRINGRWRSLHGRGSESDEDGRYRLHVAGDADVTDYYVRADVERDLRPDAKPVTARAGVESQVPDLVLLPGHSITGWVVDRESNGVPGVVVQAGRVSPIPEELNLVGAGHLHSHGGSTAETTDDGWFELSGLDTATYSLNVDSSSELHFHGSVSEDSAGVEIMAPAEGVEVPYSVTTLSIEVTLEGRAVVGAYCCLASTGEERKLASSRTGPEGRVEFGVLPGRVYEITARHDEREEGVQLIDVPESVDDHRELVVLRPKTPRGTLRVRLMQETGDPVGQAWFRLLSAGEQDRSGFGGRSFLLDASAGLYELNDLEPGTHRVFIRPGADAGGSGGYFLEEELEIEMVPGQEIERAVRVRSAGVLIVRAIHSRTDRQSSSCLIRDREGNPLPVHFVYREPGGGYITGRKLHPEGPCHVTPSLAPGIYELEITAPGHQPVFRTVEMRPFETESVHLVIED